MELSYTKLRQEIYFKTSRSSGKGGQHVNKTESKAELRFQVKNSQLLSVEQKIKILDKLKNHINDVGEFILVSQDSRSQLQNKEICLARFYSMLNKCFEKQKKRIPVKISRAKKERRLNEKKRRSEVKKWRGKFTERN